MSQEKETTDQHPLLICMQKSSKNPGKPNPGEKGILKGLHILKGLRTMTK